MSWRWLIFDYVDRDIRLSRAQRRRIHRSSLRHLHRIKIPLVIFLVIAGVLAVPVVPLLLPHSWSLFPGLWYEELTPIVLVLWFVIGGYLGLAYVMGRFEGPACWKALRDHGYDTCAKCGYWLQGLPEDEDRCPECGAKRQPMPEAGRDGDGDGD